MSDDHRLARAVRSLAQKMASFCHGRPLDRQLVSDVMGLYEDHRTRARLEGVDFPEMVLLILDERKQLRFVRRNLTPRQIDVLIQDVYTEYRAKPDEIARAADDAVDVFLRAYSPLPAIGPITRTAAR